jgi:adenosine deaminase
MHPIRKLYDAGVKVTVNTDDALVFGPSASGSFSVSIALVFLGQRGSMRSG